MSTISDLTRNVDIHSAEAKSLPRPAWASEIAVDTDGEGVYFAATFGQVLLAQSATRPDRGAPWSLDPAPELVIDIEGAITVEALRSLAADLMAAARALEPTVRELRRSREAMARLADLEG